jgi:hypothetical protein
MSKPGHYLAFWRCGTTVAKNPIQHPRVSATLATRKPLEPKHDATRDGAAAARDRLGDGERSGVAIGDRRGPRRPPEGCGVRRGDGTALVSDVSSKREERRMGV